MFQLKSDFKPQGSQPEAIAALVRGIKENQKDQVLLGITGSGKTFTMANVIEQVQKPTLVLAHNKTLAAQLYQEFKTFFPDNAVEYFVSYYDYYQPEAYIARSDTYIEKDLAINDQIERMRLSATRSLIEREDVIIISSVSCIYGIGSPDFYREMCVQLAIGQEMKRDDLLLSLVSIYYKRNDMELSRSNFRARGDVVEVALAYEESLALRIEFFGDEIEAMCEIDSLTGRVLQKNIKSYTIYPGSHNVTPKHVRDSAISTIRKELDVTSKQFEKEDKIVERQRIMQRTKYDIEMIKEIGFCKGIENYSRHFDKRKAGEPPVCLMNYFPKDYLLFVDESHQMLPQVKAMYNGDRARKKSLIEFGFRLPSAYDNRPLQFEEFWTNVNQAIYVSATPAPFEIEKSKGVVVEQIIRPTGLLDPIIEIRPATGQVDDCLEEIQKEKEKGGRVLVTTLTKKLSEDLSKYLTELNVKAKYLHSDIVTLERMEIIKELRQGKFDVLVGINLLREGLDIPEVSLVVILDADKEGFLRSETALVQTCGRAARNEEGRVILYADKKTKSINACIKITQSRRILQDEYNKKHGIIPHSIKKEKIENLNETFKGGPEPDLTSEVAYEEKWMTDSKKISKKIKELQGLMKKSAKEFRFEDAAKYRDELKFYVSLELLEDDPQ
ncbi:MAG: excinuclease ABC subunit UvrB [Rhabdochlamydiaceae bacterium]|nr:excinuclease ABC subunit UvrB [Candidatus Amphrikana amoebophyrae]